MESKNWRVTPGEEPVPCDDNWKPIEKPKRRMTLREFFLKEYGHTPSRHHGRANTAIGRRKNRKATKAGWRKEKREAKA